MTLQLRCTALNTDLDGSDSVQRSHEHTQALYDMFDGNTKELSEGYGVVADITVCLRAR